MEIPIPTESLADGSSNYKGTRSNPQEMIDQYGLINQIFMDLSKILFYFVLSTSSDLIGRGISNSQSLQIPSSYRLNPYKGSSLEISMSPLDLT
jgi:hypothetical protein